VGIFFVDGAGWKFFWLAARLVGTQQSASLVDVNGSRGAWQ